MPKMLEIQGTKIFKTIKTGKVSLSLIANENLLTSEKD